MSSAKRNSLLLLVLAGVFTIILAMSLPHLSLSPGEPFSLEQPQTSISGETTLFPGGDVLFLILKGMLALALILLPIYIGYSLLTAEGRRRLIVHVVIFVLLLLLANYLQEHPLQPPQQQQEQAVLTSLDPGTESTAPTAVFSANPPTWLSLIIILAISILLVLLILVLIWFVRQRAEPSDLLFEKLAETAQETINSLQAGVDFKSSVIRCYEEMSRVVKAERGIVRESAMTPREFEERLVSRGLPHQAIRTLTRLFEQVRYGGIVAGTRELNLAVACLTDIVNACGGTNEPS